jgi:hypothetical protein
MSDWRWRMTLDTRLSGSVRDSELVNEGEEIWLTDG